VWIIPVIFNTNKNLASGMPRHVIARRQGLGFQFTTTVIGGAISSAIVFMRNRFPSGATLLAAGGRSRRGR
jgi:hypothetical protein